MTTETQAPDPAPEGLPQFIRAEVERAIAKAVAPTGMSTHDGKAVIGHDKLRYMLALIDSQAAKLAAIPAPEGAQLPPLPDTAYVLATAGGRHEPSYVTSMDGYTEEQMQDYARAALAAPAEDIADLRESAAMLNQIGLLLRNQQARFVGSWVEIVRQMCEALAAPAPQAPVAWCELTAGGQIAYFDGKPMVMPGPVGNDCHPHPLYLGPAPQTKEPTNDR